MQLRATHRSSGFLPRFQSSAEDRTARALCSPVDASLNRAPSFNPRTSNSSHATRAPAAPDTGAQTSGTCNLTRSSTPGSSGDSTPSMHFRSRCSRKASSLGSDQSALGTSTSRSHLLALSSYLRLFSPTTRDFLTQPYMAAKPVLTHYFFAEQPRRLVTHCRFPSHEVVRATRAKRTAKIGFGEFRRCRKGKADSPYAFKLGMPATSRVTS